MARRRVSLNVAAPPSGDRRLLYTAAFVRAIATGLIGVLLGVYLARVGLDAARIGIVVTAGLAGAATSTFFVTFLGDRMGHRRALLVLTVLASAGGVALALSTQPVALIAAAFLGMVNGMGRDRGAALVLEQAMLPATVRDSRRTLAFAGYNVAQDAGHAIGGLLAGLPTLLGSAWHVAEPPAFRLSVGLYALLCVLPVLAYARLSPAVEGARVERHARVSPESRRILWRISSLFAIDGVGGGFLTTASSPTSFTSASVSAWSGSGLFLAARVAQRGVASGRGLAFAPHRAGEHDGVHAHSIESSAGHGRLRTDLSDRRRAVSPARGPGRDGRAHAPVVRDGAWSARKNARWRPA